MKKVLVIEDNEDNFNLICYPLKRHGYHILHATNGLDGIELAKKERPDFILMDIHLPLMDGIETTKILKSQEETKHIPVFAITSFAMVGDRERILEAGCEGYFEKPIDPITIMDKIHEILDGRKDEDTNS